MTSHSVPISGEIPLVWGTSAATLVQVTPNSITLAQTFLMSIKLVFPTASGHTQLGISLVEQGLVNHSLCKTALMPVLIQPAS